MTDLETQLRSLAVDRPDPAGSGEIRRRADRRRRRRRGFLVGGIGLSAVLFAFGLFALNRDTTPDQRVAAGPTSDVPASAFTLDGASEIGVEPSTVFDRLGVTTPDKVFAGGAIELEPTPDREARLYRPVGSESWTDTLVLTSEAGGGDFDYIAGELVDLGGVDGLITLDAWPTVMWAQGGQRYSLGGGDLDLDGLADAARLFVAADAAEDIDGWTLIGQPELRDLAHPLAVSLGGPAGWAGAGYVDTPGGGGVVLAWAPGDEDRLQALVATAADRTRLDDGSWLLDDRRFTQGSGVYTARSGYIVITLAVGIDDERLIDIATRVDSLASSEFDEAVAQRGLDQTQLPLDIQAVFAPQPTPGTANEPVTLRGEVSGVGIEATASDPIVAGAPLQLRLSIIQESGTSSFNYSELPDAERRLALTHSERIDGSIVTAITGIAATGLDRIEVTAPVTGETFDARIIGTEPLGDGRLLFLAATPDGSTVAVESVTLHDDLGPTTFIPPG